MTVTTTPGGRTARLRHVVVLVLLLVTVALLFSAAGRRFTTADNVANIVRHSVEIGLLALVMQPVILAGGIDLSVGSLLGLCAVLFGKLWRDAGLSWELSALATLGLGALAGGFNAMLITGLRLAGPHCDPRHLFAVPRPRRSHHARDRCVHGVP